MPRRKKHLHFARTAPPSVADFLQDIARDMRDWMGNEPAANEFCRSEIARIVGVSERMARRYIEAGIEAGKLRAVGSRRSRANHQKTPHYARVNSRKRSLDK